MTDYKDRVSGWPTDIDWSKAPEGATHYMPETESSHAVWVMVSGNTRLAWLASGDSSWEIDRSLEEDREYLIPRPAQQWNGEGLPPVGTECEILNNDLSNAAWEKCTILFSGKHRIVYDSESCSERVGYRDCLQFRPIKTPAQIAADEREAAIEAMWKIYWQPDAPTAKEALGLLWDAGLRFPKGDDK